MENKFSDLITQFGVPKIIIPNKKYTRADFRQVNGEWQRRATFYDQIKYGNSEFLAISSRTETWISNEKILIDYFKAQNLEILETVYFYKNRWAWDYQTEDWKEAKVSIATSADVETLNREDLLKSIDEKRVIWVVGWRSMGDGYVDFHLGSSEFLPNSNGYHFLFEPPCRLSESMLVEMGKDYEWDEAFFTDYSDYFSRPFLMDK